MIKHKYGNIDKELPGLIDHMLRCACLSIRNVESTLHVDQILATF